MTLDNVDAVFPLSPLQEGMLYHTITNPESGGYIEQVCVSWNCEIRFDHFREAFNDVLEHHAALRTVFLWDGLERPLQVVRKEVEAPWEHHDWRDADEPERSRRWNDLLIHDRSLGFDLAQAPLMRLHLIQEADDKWRWLWSLHHILGDGWSGSLVVQQLQECYAAKVAGRDYEFPPATDYQDYLSWLSSQDEAAAREYWNRTFKGFQHGSRLALIDVDEAPRRQGYGKISKRLTSEATKELTDWARSINVTPSVMVHAAWSLMLSRYTGESDIVHGATTSGRPAGLPNVENAVGLYLNTLPLRMIQRANDTVGDWLHRMQEQLLGLLEHEYSPLIKIPGWCELPQTERLFESLVVTHKFPEQTASPALEADRQAGFPVLKFEDIEFVVQSSYPLAVVCTPSESFELEIVHDRSKFGDETAERMLDHLLQLMQSFVGAESMDLKTLSMLTPADHAAHERLGDAGDCDESHWKSIHQWFEHHADASPDATAVTSDSGSMTYRELEIAANKIAQQLLALGQTTGCQVGVLSRRCPDLIVGILGVLKAGAAYVPLDPAYPPDHVRQVLDQAGIEVVVEGQDLGIDQSIRGKKSVSTFYAMNDPDASSIRPWVDVSRDDSAYMIFTSGSTGTPKGVRVSHGNLLHSTEARCDFYQHHAARFMLLSSAAFDSSVAGIFGTLCAGGTLVLPPENIHQDIHQLGEFMRRHSVTDTLMLPSLYQVLLEEVGHECLKSLRSVIVAGEACPEKLPSLHFSIMSEIRDDSNHPVRLFNEYGPTEATVWCSVHEITENELSGPVPIGKAIRGTRLYVLDDNMMLQAVGLPGQLFIAGPGVATGYHDDSSRTAECFLDLEIGDAAAQRTYKTGDRVIVAPDGNLRFLGRVDRQVKVRGHRIEPEEIEAQLLEHPLVEDAVVSSETFRNEREGTDPIDAILERLMTLSPEHADRLLHSVEGGVPE